MAEDPNAEPLPPAITRPPYHHWADFSFPSAQPPLQTKAKSIRKRFLKETCKCSKKGLVWQMLQNGELPGSGGGRGEPAFQVPCGSAGAASGPEAPKAEHLCDHCVTTSEPGRQEVPGKWAVGNFSGPLPSILTTLPLPSQEPKTAPPYAQQHPRVPLFWKLPQHCGTRSPSFDSVTNYHF